MIRFVIQIVAICVLFAAPYIAFQMRINEAFLAAEEAGAWNLVRFAKFGIYGLAAPAFVLTICFFGGKRRMLWCAVSGGIFALALLTVTNYYDYFGVVPHWNQLGNLDQTGMVGGHIKSQLLGWGDLLSVISISVGVVLISKLEAFPSQKWERLIPAIVGLPAILLLGLQLVRYPIFNRLNSHGYTMGCSHYGIFPTYAVMLKDFLPRETRTVPFPFERPVLSPTPFSGKLRGSNVLIVQVESMDAELLGRRIGGTPVMPFLEQLASENAYFSECFAMHAGGGSSDAELASLLSLVPLTSGSGFATANWKRVRPLSRILNDADYTCIGMHSNRGSFYERSRRYADMGFAEFHDQMSFTGDAAGWYAKDDEFFEQSVQRLRTLPEPFFGYLITLQSHGPFRNYREATSVELESKLLEVPKTEKDYLISFSEVDQALERLFSSLESAGLLSSTLVVIYGDHESGLANNKELPGERVPLVFCHPKLSAFKTKDPVSHIDIAPTITDLLGEEPAPSWLGKSVFWDQNTFQIFLPNGKAIINGKAEFNDVALRVVDYSKAMLGR